MKTCNKCGETKALTEFYKDKGKRDGLRSQCKSCTKVIQKAYREANPEKIKARSKAYYETNKEKIKAYKKAYREANPEKEKARQKAYYETNKEKIKARSKAYYEANPEKIKAYKKAYHQANLEKIKARSKAYREAHKEEAMARHKAWCEANPERLKAYQKAYYEASKEKRKVYNKAYHSSPRGRFSSYRSNAKKRNIPFLLTEEEFKGFWQKPCVYCGAEIETIGLDRVDSSGPYHIDNVVPCCWPCNENKGTRSLKEWTEITLARAKRLNPEEFNK